MHYAEMVAVTAVVLSAGISFFHYIHQAGVVAGWWPFASF
jgi:hypothetical protein